MDWQPDDRLGRLRCELCQHRREILRGSGSYSNTDTHGNSDSDSNSKCNTKCYSDGHPYCDADRNTCNAAHSDPTASSHTGASSKSLIPSGVSSELLSAAKWKINGNRP
jgi:hypothetical protein